MQLLPTTMVGSYPRPAWFTHQLAGRDVLEAFKVASHAEAFHDAIERGPVRMALIYQWAQRHTTRPIKACVGAGPVQLSTLAHFRSGPVKNRYDLSRALAEVFRAEIKELVAAGCKHVQLEDLGAWMPHLSGDKDWDWVSETIDRTMADIPQGVERAWHFCMGN